MNTPPDPATAKLIEQLDALGATYAREARERGVAERVCAASLLELNRTPAVVGRLHWRQWAGGLAAAAVLTLAVLIPLGVFNSADHARDNDMILAVELAPANLPERTLIGLVDHHAAIESFEPSSIEGGASVAVTSELHASEVQGEIESLLALGGGK